MKTFLILFPFALVGVGLGAAWVGIIEVPGLSPEARVARKKVDERPATSHSTPQLEPLPPKAPVVVAPETDLDAGQKKLAYLWEGVEIDKLVAIVDKWRDSDLAAVLAKM